MRSRIKQSEWVPQGVAGLEDAALRAVKAKGNALVVAGPGAGKTELLAQRACFLLQTGACPWPKQILAISFKRDAARNLAERVKLRCGSELATRFHSYTFDAFAKTIVDRFGQAVPQEFRPDRNYEIGFHLGPWNAGDIIREELPIAGSMLKDSHRQTINGQEMYWQSFIGRCLTTEFGNTTAEIAAKELWHYMLYGPGGSELNFHMIGRVAQLALMTNPKVLRALRSAYGYVFLDEFQDTSSIHYDLVRTAFKGSRVVITAVGDNKQRVNKWAGALENVFGIYREEFDAERFYLLVNYRSARELVRIQAFIAASIDETAPAAVAAKKDGPEGECRSLVFTTYEAEAKHLAEMIRGWIHDDGLKPRDVCVLSRQRPDAYAKLLQQELFSIGVSARVENALQDLVSEPLTSCIIAVLRLCCPGTAGASWIETVDLLSQLRRADAEADERREVSRLRMFLRRLAGKLPSQTADEKSVKELLREIVAFFGKQELKSFFPQYAQGKYFHEIFEGVVTELSKRITGQPLADALDDFEGVNSVPIMTMHKSKGLEYHTVVFIGLEDAALRGFEREPDEETCGFFVALSRAKERAVFTFSKQRNHRGSFSQPQSRRVIKPLYDLLDAAGVHPEELA